MANTIRILPESGRPKITQAELEKQLEDRLSEAERTKLEDYRLQIIGIRGYFASMGEPGVNDRNVYDDAIILHVPSLQIYNTFNGNTDPSRIHKGYGKGKMKGMAVLNPGVWPVYRFDTHNGSAPHEAICQRLGAVKVTRDGNPPYGDTGNFGINIHRGGYVKTSSLGCQTIPPEQWNEFYNTAKKAALSMWKDNWKKEVVVYVLVENE
jgi:lysozyme